MVTFQNILPEIEYCEPFFKLYFQEPLNTVSNTAFLIAFFALYKITPLKNRSLKRLDFFLVVLVGIAGIGSILYHGYRHPITLLLDVVPIIIIFILSFWRFLTFITRNKTVIYGALILFIVVELAVPFFAPKGFLNGSTRYAVGLMTLLIISYFTYRKYGEKAKILVGATFVFGIAILFRSVDNVLCTVIPFGTHFLWHIIVAGAIYLVIRFMLRAQVA